jgi:Fe-S-cluster containining protein
MVEGYECENCGACCRVRNCIHITEDNKCAIFETRPDVCRSDKVAEALGLSDEEYCELAIPLRELLREVVYGPGGMSDAVQN